MKITYFINSLILVVMCSLATGCVSTKKMYYMQGIDDMPAQELTSDYQLHIQPDDQLAISINSRDRELIAPFNSYMIIGTGGGQSNTGSSTAASSATQSGMAYFQVNQEGNIHFPILGDLKVQGMTNTEVAAMLEQKLCDGNYVKDPSVKVKIMSFKVTVLGEVKNPGVQNLTNERLTILEALGKAGDLLPSGQRENILVMREVNGKRESYRVDLTQAEAVVNSPAYYLQQNDVVYVTPNSAIKVKGSATGTYLGLYGSILGVLASIASLIVVVTK
ncbi:MAG: polysaccharide biosynthesis/export family protein [Bacteroidales bacterium]|nr:polysaccharide biosynthesis/export family protein [Bacteroidales bacterium]